MSAKASYRQLAQRIKFTYRMECFVKNVPVKKPKRAKEIKGRIDSPASLIWLHDNEVIRKVKSRANRNHSAEWIRGPNWQPVIDQIEKMERNLKYY